MWSEICKDYIPYDCYLYDIEGNRIDRGTIVENTEGFKYKFQWNGDNQEWVAISLREENKEYPMYQERVDINRFKII